jgi:hypothetical protein
VQDIGGVVIDAADAMADEIPDHAIAVPFGMPLDRVADIAQPIARLGLLDPEHQAFVGDVDQPPRLHRHLADQIHAARIAMPAVNDRGQVDIDDITVFQRPRAGNAMADDMVDRDAARMSIAAIADIRRNRPGRDDRLTSGVVERFGADAGRHHVGQGIQHRGSDLARLAHRGEFLRAVELDGAGPAIRAGRCGRNIVGHRRLYCPNGRPRRDPQRTMATDRRTQVGVRFGTGLGRDAKRAIRS